MSDIRYILGTSSKWRQEIAAKTLKHEVEIISPDIDEKLVVKETKPKSPEDHCNLISRAKLDKLISILDSKDTCIVMCFDTVTLYGDNILEKPTDDNEMMSMLNMWLKKNSVVEVLTSISMCNTSTGTITTECQRAKIKITRDLTKEEFNKYTSSKHVRHSSGALICEDLIEINACVLDGDLSIIQGFPHKRVSELVSDLLK